MRKANAIGGNTDSDIEAGRKGGSGTSMAFVPDVPACPG